MDKEYRAYSVLTLDEKGMKEDEEKVVIKGMASTPSPDRMNDVVDPMGAKFSTPMPLLWQHMHDKPIGLVTFASPTKKGIPFEAEIPKIKESGTLKDRIDEAIQSIQYGLVAAVSIGFRAVEGAYEFMENGGIHFKEWEWYELSAVTIPANSDAVITAVKSADRELLSASGREKALDSDTSPGVSGSKQRPIQLIPRGNSK